MTGEQSDEETGDHHKCPYRPGNEGLLLLLIFGLGGILEVKTMLDLHSEAILHWKLTCSFMGDDLDPLPFLLGLVGSESASLTSEDTLRRRSSFARC